jgi:hypothetical protein
MFWLVILLFVGTTVLSALLQKRPKDVQPAGTSDFQVPTAEEGRVIPVIYGTVLNSGPNVVWWGDLQIHALTQKSGGFLGIGAKKVTTGYKYNVGMQMALCHGPVDEVVGIQVGEKDLSYPDPAGDVSVGLSYAISQGNLFGGDQKEGGISGVVDIYMGSTSQASDPYLSRQFGGTAPAFRGLCYAVLQNVYVGTSQYIKNWAFILRRCPNPLSLTGGKENIGGDANPACMIYDLMASTRYGLSVGSLRFDLSSFQAVANTLYTESMGMSMILDTPGAADEIISEICRHCNLVLYTDPGTGLWTLKAIRDDYDPDSLLEFTDDDILDEIEFSRPSFPDLLNEVKVEFISRVDAFQTRLAQAQDLAVYSQQLVSQSETIQYHGFSNADNAQVAAQRDLKAASYPLAQVQVKVNRKGWALRPGSPFKMTWSPEGINSMVLRVAEIDYGALDDSEMAITIKAVEDIFLLASTAYSAPPTSGWTEPVSAPSSAPNQRVFDAPFHLVTLEERHVIDVATRPDGSASEAQVWTEEVYIDGHSTPSTETASLAPFTPASSLMNDYLATTAAVDMTGFIVSAADGVDLSRLTSAVAGGVDRGDNLLMIDDEIMSWGSVSTNMSGDYVIADVVRGVMDTVPADHYEGAVVWFFSNGSVVTNPDPYSDDLHQVVIRNLPVTPAGTLSPGGAPELIFLPSNRVFDPYPPGKLRINGTDANVEDQLTTDLTLTWAHRNRHWQLNNKHLTAQDEASDPLGVEGTYSVRGVVGLAPYFFAFADGTLAISGIKIVNGGEAGLLIYAKPIGIDIDTFDRYPNVISANPTRPQSFFDNTAGAIIPWAPYTWTPGELPEYNPLITLTGGVTTFHATPYGDYAIGIDTATGNVMSLPTGTVTYPDSISIVPAPAAYPPANWIELATYTYVVRSGGDPAGELGKISVFTDVRPRTEVVNVTAVTGTSQVMTKTDILAVGADPMVPAFFEIETVNGSDSSQTRVTAPIWIS